MADDEVKTVPKVDLRIPEGTRFVATDVIVAQHSVEKGTFYLTFYQTQPPLLPDEDQATITADCVARLAMSPQILFKVMEVLQRNFQRFQEDLQKQFGAANNEAGAEKSK